MQCDYDLLVLSCCLALEGRHGSFGWTTNSVKSILFT